MKTLLLLVSGMLSAADPGCGAAIGGDTANGGDGSPIGTVDSGSLATMDCGALGTHVFCDDFGDAALPGKWEDETVSGGSVALDTSEYVSPPQSLLATTVALSSGTRTYARIEKHVATSGSRFQVAFSEWVDPACVGPSDTVQSLSLAFGNDGYWLAVAHSGGGDSVIESSLANGVYVQAHGFKTQLLRAAWTRISLDVDVARGMFDVSVDGATVIEHEPLKYPPGAPQLPTITVGTLTDGAFNEAACKMHIDDVTFDMQP
jgi:hypothetical protein